jgi:hypothetical protein
MQPAHPYQKTKSVVKGLILFIYRNNCADLLKNAFFKAVFFFE